VHHPIRAAPFFILTIALFRQRSLIALSPDGSTIAATTAHLGEDKIKPADRGLFLVDLRGPGRKVTKIPYPRAQQASGKIPKE
jgi:hypothetical protein